MMTSNIICIYKNIYLHLVTPFTAIFFPLFSSQLDGALFIVIFLITDPHLLPQFYHINYIIESIKAFIVHYTKYRVDANEFIKQESHQFYFISSIAL